MGPSWVSVRNAVADGTLRHTNPGATEVAGRFDALLRFAALQLSTRLGTDVTVVYSLKDSADPSSRIAAHVANMVDHGRLQGSLRLECTIMNQRGSGTSDLLGRVRENPELLVLDPSKTICSFSVALNSPMGLKSGRGQGSFIDGLLTSVDTFYTEVLQGLKAWSAKPPRLREQIETAELAKEQDVPPGGSAGVREHCRCVAVTAAAVSCAVRQHGGRGRRRASHGRTNHPAR